jgi:hypothetical protein
VADHPREQVLWLLPTGSGTLRWSAGSARPVAFWDFDVEID